MNCYFVFEGQTEPIVYKSWLSHLVPDLKEVPSLSQVASNNYIEFSDAGLPELYKVVGNAIADICEASVTFDYLVVVLDADQLSLEQRKQKLYEYLSTEVDVESSMHCQLPPDCELIIIVQKVCIETWFLGNSRFFPTAPESEKLREYKKYYDVCTQDPEQMAASFTSVNKSKLFGCYTRAQFHAKYFNEIFKERTRKGYKKKDPKEVTEQTYLQELINRHQNTQDLATFGTFLDFCKILNPSLSKASIKTEDQ